MTKSISLLRLMSFGAALVSVSVAPFSQKLCFADDLERFLDDLTGQRQKAIELKLRAVESDQNSAASARGRLMDEIAIESLSTVQMRTDRKPVAPVGESPASHAKPAESNAIDLLNRVLKHESL